MFESIGLTTPPCGDPVSGCVDAPVLEDTRVEPFADQSQQHPVSYPTPEKVPQVAVVHRIEKLPDVHVHDPAPSDPHRLLPEAVQRPMRRSSGPEAVRAVLEVLLVDRFQHHDDRPLEYLILEGRNPQRPSLGRRARLGDMDPPHRRCLVRAGLGSVQQRLKVAHQVRCVVLAVLSVHAHCPVFAGAVEGLRTASRGRCSRPET